MLIELIENKETEWMCQCHNHYYTHDIEGRAYITIDNIRFFKDTDIEVKELVQFPYTFSEWEKGKVGAYRCDKCATIIYRVIENKSWKERDINY